MKHLFFLISLTFLLNACCTKKFCEGTIYDINLYNFGASDLDTVIVIRYAGDDTFRKLLDSTRVYITEQSDGSSTLPVKGGVNINENYKIIMYGTNLEYRIMGLQTTRKGCNSCFPIRPASDYYDVLDNYNLNGELWTREDISIWR